MPERFTILDVQERRAVTPDAAPTGPPLACDVLVAGGGVGGVAAATALLAQGLRVILTEPTRVIGGQLTSQLVAAPDENRYIERENGPSTAAYRRLRAAVRAHYADLPEVVSADVAANIGGCWVSRVSGTPDVWERLMRGGLSGATTILMRHQIVGVGVEGDSAAWADAADLDTGRVTRIRARFLLDATEDGSLLELAGIPTAIGQEARSEYGEPDAPEEARPDWIQSFTYGFLVRWVAPGEPIPIRARPEEYTSFRATGEYTLDYVYSDPPRLVPYRVLTRAEGAAGPFWTYRRLLASSSFLGGASPVGDVALINWRGNDFNGEPYLGRPVAKQVRALERGRSFAQGFLYWLQTECPRDDGGIGYPEMQPLTGGALPALDDDGLAIHPYVRESRRLARPVSPLVEQHLTAADGDDRWGTTFFDSIGCAHYAIDIHPAAGEPHRLARALPYHLPLGALLTTTGPRNVLPAAKNFGASRLALASARMHPTEWLVGEAAGTLAAFCLQRGIDDPGAVRASADLLSSFQSTLRAAGIPLVWSEIMDA
jgi:hypothetical protein